MNEFRLVTLEPNARESKTRYLDHDFHDFYFFISFLYFADEIDMPAVVDVKSIDHG